MDPLPAVSEINNSSDSWEGESPSDGSILSETDCSPTIFVFGEITDERETAWALKGVSIKSKQPKTMDKTFL